MFGESLLAAMHGKLRCVWQAHLLKWDQCQKTEQWRVHYDFMGFFAGDLYGTWNARCVFREGETEDMIYTSCKTVLIVGIANTTVWLVS